MRWFRLGLRIFLPAAALFGLILGVLSASVEIGLFAGVFFGLAMAGVLTEITAIRTRRRGGSLSTRQRTQLVLHAAPDEVHARAVTALAQLPAKITSDSAQRVVGRTRISWWSWGEIVTVDLHTDGPATALEIASRPWARATMADYGRNHDNVTHLAAGLQNGST